MKQIINTDFIEAMKSKNQVAKLAISGIKAKIVEAEKEKRSELTDDEIIKVINKAVIQREESANVYRSIGRHDLEKSETDEAQILRKYLPALMTPEEIEYAVKEIALLFTGLPNENARKGKTLGEFNKRYTGRADLNTVKTIIDKLV